MKQMLDNLIHHKPLSKEAARDVLLRLASGDFNTSQVSAFLTVYMMRAITLAELQGFREAMLELCIPVRFEEPVMDVCGTGGDGMHTFNISTLASFVVAAAGQPVAKHGNYGVSSVSGSSNVLEYLGYRLSNRTDQLQRSLQECGICFMHAPLFHPAMKHVAQIRKDLGVKTFFNMLGPLVNPAAPPRQLTGVFSLELARLYGYLFQDLGKSYVVLHDLQGYDEISLTGPFKVFTPHGEQILEPEDLGLSSVTPTSLRGGATVEASARIFMNILNGEGSEEQVRVVAANAGMSLYACNPGKGLQTLVELALETLRSGKALTCFNKFMAMQLT